MHWYKHNSLATQHSHPNVPHGERQHDAVRVLLADLGDQQGAHAGARAAAQRVRDLEALQAVAALRLLAHHIQHAVNQLRALRVVALGPVVARAGLAEHKVVRAEQLAEGARAHRVHGAGLQVHQDGARHVAAARRLVEVHIDALQLQVAVAMEDARGVHAAGFGGGVGGGWDESVRQRLDPRCTPRAPPTHDGCAHDTRVATRCLHHGAAWCWCQRPVLHKTPTQQ